MNFALPIVLALAPQTAAIEESPPEHLVEVHDTAASRARLLDLGLSPHPPDWLASDADLAALEASGIRYTVLARDMEEVYRQHLRPMPVKAGTLGGWLSPPFAGGAMGGYYTFAQMSSVLDQISSAYPALVSPKQSLGQSWQGRDLWMIEISDNPGVDEGEPEVRIDGLHHAREPMSFHAPLWFVLWLLDSYGSDPLATFLVDERRLFFVPVVNPDGYVYNQQQNPGGGGLWRKNRRNNGDGSFGVDLNRNYDFQWGFDNEGSSPNTGSDVYRGPFAASEPEIQAMQTFYAGRDFVTAASVHTYSDVLLHAWGYTTQPSPQLGLWSAMSALLTASNGIPHGPAGVILYLANGTTLDYDFAVNGTYCWTPELGNQSEGFWPSTGQIVPMAQKHIEMWKELVRVAGAAVEVQSVATVDLGDGDGNVEPGEVIRVDVTLRNTGLSTTGTSVIVDLDVPGATVSGAPVDLGTLASGAAALASPTFQVEADTLAGTALTWTLSVTHDGFTQTHAESVVVGEPVAIVRDDLEVELGWIAGVPGDDATTGHWERGNPIGTTSSGSQASPEDDNTPGPGNVQCYVTGNGGGSGGNDDVDDGKTTLISPPIDLSSVGPARMTYARWFADLSSADDVLEVSITSDGGQNWVPVEVLAGNHNSWESVTFVVSDLVPQTGEVRLRVVATDDPNNSVVEAAIDDLVVEVYDAAPRLVLYGTPALGTPILATTTGEEGSLWAMYGALGPASIPLPGIGLLELDPFSLFQVASGAIPAGGAAELLIPLPGNPSSAGTTVHLQAGLIVGLDIALTNSASFTLE